MGDPLEFIPFEAWLGLALVITAWGPATYVWRYFTYERAPRDITLPSEDLSWKSSSALYRSLAMLAGLLGVGIFIFTPQAEQFARSEWLAPTLFGLLGSYALSTIVRGWRSREVEPLIRGVSRTFRRDDQPKRYWASLGWNAILGSGLMAASLGIAHEKVTPRCDDPDSDVEAVLRGALSACNTMLLGDNIDRERRADILAARGRIYHRLGNTSEAVRAYSEAIDLDPIDSYSLYNRGSLLLWLGQPDAAVDDLDASLALRPDNDEAYIERGVAHAWLGHRELAEKDFGRIGFDSPFWSRALEGRAGLAIEEHNYAEAIDLATKALQVDPGSTFALRLRADAYWEIGQEDLARRDDDRRMDLEEMRRSE